MTAAPTTSPAEGASELPADPAAMAPGSALVLALLIGSTFTILLNEMLLGVALPTLITDLGITPSTGQWLTTGYLLTLAVLIPATGFVMRRFHLRTIFLSAMVTFILGTTIAAVATNFPALLTGRIVQAAGTAVFLPLLMTTTMRLVPAARRGQVMAVVMSVPAIAPAVGPALAGIILSGLHWRWLFILMLPVVVLALLLGAWKLRNISTPEPVTLDVASLLLSAIGFGALVYGLAAIGESVSGHSALPPYGPIAVGLVALALFVRRQISLQRGPGAFLDVRIFAVRDFSVPLLVSVLVALISFGSQIVLPLVLTDVTGLTTLSLGLFLVPGGIVLAISAALGGKIYDRYGPRPLAIPGAVAWAGALWFFSTVHQGTSIGAILAAYLVFNAGQAMVWPIMTTTALSALQAEFYPHGTAALNTIQQLAGAAGGAVLISAYTIGLGASDTLGTPQAAAAGQAAFTTAAVLSLLALVGTFFVRRVTTTASAGGAPASTAPAIEQSVTS